jgi:glucose-6-phosphate isomerase
MNPAAWTALKAAAEADAGRKIVDLFAAEPDRLARMTLEAAGLYLDLSKQPWSAAGLDAALALAQAARVEDARDAFFGGDPINLSEDRAVLHPALRAPTGAHFQTRGEAVSPLVEKSRAALRTFADGVGSGKIAAADGKPFTAILHIGIGGSDLGPRMAWEALKPLAPRIDLKFAANVDPSDIAFATAGLDPARTLVVLVSKTFTTQETMANARAARAWLEAALGDKASGHLAAVSTNLEATAAFGVAPERVFGFWDWVGGRYSVWSAVGLSLAVALGWEAFQGFLDGAAAMDAHFVAAPLEKNAPVLLALAHIYNRNGFGRPIRAVVPYAQRLVYFPAFLQQLEMESNGKRVTRDGQPVGMATAASVFGDAGTNGQHAFFQLLHQGTDVIPVDFIAVARASEGPAEQQAMLLANVLAQAEALMTGADAPEPHRRFPGNRASSLILLDALTPRAFGALVALYEHKTFVEGVIWDINSFDQWGVELGKTLAVRILGELTGGRALAHDPSTAHLIARLKAQLKA